MYNYRTAMYDDVMEAVKERKTNEQLIDGLNFSDELFDELYDELWLDDSVTGNASGSYTFNTWQAEENICHNMDLLKEAFCEFGGDISEAIEQGAEFCDVTIRCYLLGEILREVLDDLENELLG